MSMLISHRESQTCYGMPYGTSVLQRSYRFRVSEKWALRIIYGPKNEEKTGEQRILRKEEFHEYFHHMILRLSNQEA
jgi:hypothetical protein